MRTRRINLPLVPRHGSQVPWRTALVFTCVVVLLLLLWWL